MLQGSEKLHNVHPDLVAVIQAAAKVWELKIVEAERSLKREEELIRTGKSRLADPRKCLHVVQADGLVHAVDLVPLPLDWNDSRRFYYLGGYVRAVAKGLGLHVRWGGDWNSNTEVKDQTFNDLDHFEVPV